MIDLPDEQLERVRRILARFVPEAEIRVFGSRVHGGAAPYSDLDLAIVTNERLPQAVYYRILDAFEESDLPVRVDVLDWGRISPAFREVIEREYEIL